MMIRFSLLASALLFVVPASAQVAPSPAEEDDGGLSVTVTDENAWQDLNLAIPSFATDRNAPTPANTQGTGALALELSRVVYNDLQFNGLFRPTGPDSLPRPSYPDITSPQFGTWRGRGAEMLVQGFVRAQDDGRLMVGCYLYDVALNDELARGGWVVQPGDWRRAAHKCADLVYSRLSGESPFFDSKIAYIAETGPKDNRVKRLAIMDSDGANHRFITNGQSTALTPRYSPDYSKIAYLSYVGERMRIYVYDVGSGRQTLVTENSNATMAPRWSPDGRTILFSMATGGNTDIYTVPATGGTPRRLTDTPGIDVGGSFSPDGRRIVFESDRSGTQQCYVMDADGSNQRRVSFFGGRCATPEWSPRGDLIAFTHITGNFRIATMTPSGGSVRHLTNSWQDEAPTWSPNGRIVQFFRTAQGSSGESSIWQVDLTGRNERRLRTPVGASDPAWGPVLP
jgi:TolB protein